MLSDEDIVSTDGWFVYWLVSAHDANFKIGFSCNPLQRVYSFNRRYFERFDLRQSCLLKLPTETDARAVETTLKRTLKQFRSVAPHWVTAQAGGHTEWFNNIEQQTSEGLLSLSKLSEQQPALINAHDLFAAELANRSRSFESWAWQQAQQISNMRTSAQLNSLALAAAQTLRDWLDAYRWFDIELFNDDKHVARFVASAGNDMQ